MTIEDPSRRDDRKGRAPIFAKCVSDTSDFINRHADNSVFAFENSGLLLANCYFLVSDAYKRRRGMQDSRTHMYKVAAFTVATIMAVRPLRVADTNRVVSVAVAFANQQCAMRAAQSLLGLDLERLDDDFLRRMYSSVLDVVELPSLQVYLREFLDHFSGSQVVTFEQVEEKMSFDRFNNIDFSRSELAMLEALINQFTTLEQAIGHPFLRLLLGWRWR